MPGNRDGFIRNNSGSNLQTNLIDLSDYSGDTDDSSNNREREHGSPTDGEPASRFVRNLKFRNPGKFMEDFDPENSSREMRKLNRRIYRETVRKNQVYDERGKLLTDSRDLCDCLVTRCPGCHFPCSKCASPKCGGDCRCNRRWHYTEVEAEGTGQKTFSNIPSA